MMIGDWFGDWAGEWFGDGCGDAAIHVFDVASGLITHVAVYLQTSQRLEPGSA